MVRGRPTKPRTKEIGLYLEQLRSVRGWSVTRLASEADVDAKIVSRLEVTGIPPRDLEFMLAIARSLDIHPDNLYRKARLTPPLRPTPAQPSESPPVGNHLHDRQPHVLITTEDEFEQLEIYLDFLRYMSLSKTLAEG